MWCITTATWPCQTTSQYCRIIVSGNVRTRRCCQQLWSWKSWASWLQVMLLFFNVDLSSLCELPWVKNFLLLHRCCAFCSLVWPRRGWCDCVGVPRKGAYPRAPRCHRRAGCCEVQPFGIQLGQRTDRYLRSLASIWPGAAISWVQHVSSLSPFGKGRESVMFFAVVSSAFTSCLAWLRISFWSQQALMKGRPDLSWHISATWWMQSYQSFSGFLVRPCLMVWGDCSANWEEWWNEIGLRFSNLTGPLAPHLFLSACLERSVCSDHCQIVFSSRNVWQHLVVSLRFEIMYLKDLGQSDIPVSAWPSAPPTHPKDIVAVIRQRMSSRKFHQVALLVPGLSLQGYTRPWAVSQRYPWWHGFCRVCRNLRAYLASKNGCSAPWHFSQKGSVAEGPEGCHQPSRRGAQDRAAECFLVFTDAAVVERTVCTQCDAIFFLIVWVPWQCSL